MTQAYSEDLRKRALGRADRGETIRLIAAELQISASCVSKWRTLYQRPRMLTHGAFEDPEFIKCSQSLDKFRTEYQRVIVNDLWYYDAKRVN